MTQKKAVQFSKSYEILRYFEFKKNSQEYSSVVAKNEENDYFVFTKGEPLEVYNLCQKSTLAYNYTQTISKYSSKGYQCLALAYKQVESSDIGKPRKQLEQGLVFLGFYLKKISVQEGVVETVEKIKENNLDVVVTSNTSLYLAISAANRVNIVNSEQPILIGRTVSLNNVETLQWEKIESKKDDFENSVLEPAEDINVNEEEFYKNSSLQIAITGRAFKALVEQCSDSFIKEILPKIKIIGNMRRKDTSVILEAYKTKSKGEPIVYVHDGYGDENIQSNVEVAISLKESEQSLTASIYSKVFNLSQFLIMINESRNAIKNKHKNFTLITFFTLT